MPEKWIRVTSGKRRIKKKVFVELLPILKLDETVDKLKEYFSGDSVVGIHGIYLYGSTSRRTNTAESDVDIMIIWKKTVLKRVYNIKKDLEEIFDRKVDVVCMIYKGKELHDFHLGDCTVTKQNEIFLSYVWTDSVSIIGDKDDIRLSLHIGKIS